MASRLHLTRGSTQPEPVRRRPRRGPLGLPALMVTWLAGLAVLCVVGMMSPVVADDGTTGGEATAAPAEAPTDAAAPTDPATDPPADPVAEKPSTTDTSTPSSGSSTTGTSGTSGTTSATEPSRLALGASGPAALAAPAPAPAGDGDLDKWEQCENGASGAAYSTANPTGTGCNWITGNLTANHNNYAEGEYVLRRARLTGVTVNTTGTYVMSFDVKVGGKWAYDYLWNNQVVATGAAISGVSVVQGADNGTSRVDTATITYESTSSDVTIYIPTHIASELDHGAGLGAGSLPGSNYHTHAVALNGVGEGNRDLQMQSDAVKAGNITVIKDAQPDSTDQFTFSIVPGGPASTDFKLVDNAPGTTTNKTTYRAAPGAYTIDEHDLPAGWSLTDISCTNGVVSKTASSVKVTIVDKVTTACTFTNSKTAFVKVDKYWTVNGGTPVANGSQPSYLSADLTLTGPGAAGATAQAWGSARTGYLAGNTTTINESTSITNQLCSLSGRTIAPTGGQAVTLAAGGYAATLSGGENSYRVTNNVTCTSRLTLVKDVGFGTEPIGSWALSATAPQGSTAFASGTSGVAGSVTPGSSYALGESGTTAGSKLYVQAGSWSCTNTDKGVVVSGGDHVAVPAGVSSTCTVTNKTAKLILKKFVNNTYAGGAQPSSFQLTATPQSPPPGVDAVNVIGSNAGIASFVRPGVSYDLSESGPGGYTKSLVCDNDATPGTVNLSAGETLTCTFTNDDKPALLTLRKVVEGSDSGTTASASDFILTASPNSIVGQTQVSGNGADGVTKSPVKAGIYSLSESGPGGFDADDWQCDGGTLVGDHVSVTNGDDVTCYITNTARAPRLTLVKQVDNTGTGGTATAGQWTLHAAGPVHLDGATGAPEVTGKAAMIGSYTLSETGGPAGYTASTWVCDSDKGGSDGTVTLALGDDVTCTITNTAIKPRLTLVKHVENAGTGGTALPGAWTLSASNLPTVLQGPGGASGAVPVGTYTLAENGGPSGYSASAWTCADKAGAPRAVTGGHVDLGLGDDLTCEITNTAVKPTLTLVKHVLNGATGGDADATDWDLHAVNGQIDTLEGAGGATGKVVAGTYALSETGGVAGYLPSAWTCDKGQEGSNVTLAVGDDVTCEISNVAAAPHLTLVKHVENGSSGGTKQATDWWLSATGDSAATVAGAGTADGNLPVGGYVLAESGPSGYAASGWTCDTGHVVSGGKVTLGLGDDVTCEVTNTAVKPRLTLVKHVENTGTDGRASAADWTLSAVNGQVDALSGAGGASGDVVAGTYVLGEALTHAGGPVGYTASTWSCDSGKHAAGGTVTLSVGDDVTCTITNTAQPGTWTVEKSSTTRPDPLLPGGTIHYTLEAHHTGGVVPLAVVVNDDLSGLLAHGELGSTLPGTASVNGAGLLVWTIAALPGDATLSFDIVLDDDAWGLDLPNAVTSPGSSNCPTVQSTVEHEECTTDDHTPAKPRLTLVKDVQTGETGDEARASDWTLTATPDGIDGQGTVAGNGDPESAGGVKEVGVLPGGYELSESGGPGGYLPQGWSCDGGSLDGTTLTLVPDDDVTCTVVNEAVPGTYEVEKVSDPEDGSTVEPGQSITYTVTATHLAGVAPRNVVVTDDLSDVLDDATLVGDLPAGVVLDGTTLTWTIAKLDTTATIQYTVRVDDDAIGVSLRNVVVAPTSENCPGDEVPGEECTTEHWTPAWTLEKSSDPASGSEVAPGDQVTYTLTVVNTSEGVVQGATVDDDLSDVLDDATLDAVPTGATVSGTTLRWHLPTLQPGDTATLSYTVTVDDDASLVTLRNVAVPGQPTGSCVAQDACETTHDVPELLGEEGNRPRPRPQATVQPREGGLLPGTGGPDLGYVWSGVGLLLAGYGVLMASRRRRTEG